MSIKSQGDKSASRSLLPIELSRFLRRARHDQPCPPKSYPDCRAPHNFPKAVHTESNLTTRNTVPVQGEISGYVFLRGNTPISTLRRIHRSRPTCTDSLRRPHDSPDTTSRRFSWLPFRKSNAVRTETPSPSVPISDTNSMSFVVESTISSPMLMSTTNTHVAERENVRCNKISLLNHSVKIKPEGEDLQRGSDGLDAFEEGISGQKSVDNKQFHLTSTLQGVRKRMRHVRRASTSFLLENTWPRRLREYSPTPGAQSDISNRCVSSPVVCQDEAVDYMLNQRSKGDRFSFSGSPSLSVLNDVPTEQYVPQLGEAPRLPRLRSGSTADLLVESLSEAFTNATSKFNLQAMPAAQPSSVSLAASKLKSVRSCFSLHSVNSEVSKSADMKKGTNKSAHCMNDSHNQSALRSRQQSDILIAINKTLNTQAQKPIISSSKPVQLRFSGKKNRYIRAKPDPQGPHGVNPLRMHPEVETLARPPSEKAFPSTPSHRPKRDSSDDDGSEKIECAIIYSPSTGNLSEYSRKTSSPTLRDGTRQGRAQQETPTHKPLHKRSGSVLKRSVSSFITKSTSLMRLGNLTPSRKSKQDWNHPNLAKCTSYPEPPKTVGEGKPNIRMRGRAMSSPSLYCSEGLRAVWDYQPSTPSPLRKTTRLSDVYGARPRAVTTSTLINGSADRTGLLEARSATSGTQPGKRQGRLFLPQAEEVNIRS